MHPTGPSYQRDLPELVRRTIAQTCGLEPSNVSMETTMLDLNMDSLTLVTVIALVEAVYEIDFANDGLLELLEAADVADLVDRIEPYVSHRCSLSPARG